MFRGSNILAVGAHPDDIECGCFGTLAKYQESSKIYCYVQTGGGYNDKTNQDRFLESEAAFALLKTEHLFVSALTGIDAHKYHVYVQNLEAFLRKCEITTMFIPSEKDTHQDHRLMHAIAMTASRRRRMSILCYRSLSTTPDFRPNVFINIGGQSGLKRMAIRKHHSQEHKTYMQGEALDVFNTNSFAFVNGVTFVEAFECIQYFD